MTTREALLAAWEKKALELANIGLPNYRNAAQVYSSCAHELRVALAQQAPAVAAEPVAMVGPTFQLLWVGVDTLSDIVERSGLRVTEPTPCAGPSCGTTIAEHSRECVAEHAAAKVQGWFEQTRRVMCDKISAPRPTYCGQSVNEGQGPLAICGKQWYDGPYQCQACRRVDAALAAAPQPSDAPQQLTAEQLGKQVAEWDGGTYMKVRGDTGQPEQWIDTSVVRLGHMVKRAVDAATPPPQAKQQSVDAERLVEKVAEAIHAQWWHKQEYKMWEPGGNIFLQQKARDIARMAIDAARAAKDEKVSPAGPQTP